MAPPFIYLIAASFYFHLVSTGAAHYQPEPLGPIDATNAALSRRIVVTSDFVAAAALESPPQQDPRGSVFVKDRFSVGAAHRLSPTNANSTAHFGAYMTFHDGRLIVKDSADTHFFGKDGSVWIPDGSIIGGSHYDTAVAGVAASGSFLISGTEVYSWPAREYLQTLEPPDFHGAHKYTAEDATYLAGSPAVISYAIQTVWSYPAQGNGGFDANGVQVMPPAGAEDTGFGRRVLLLPPSGLFLLVSAPRDDEQGENSGAVHVYRRGDAGRWDYLQKLTAPQPMPGDSFGDAIAADNQRVYISAPYRNEFKSGAGAIFIFELPDLPPPAVPITRVFKEKITLTETSDNARLGQALAVHNGIVYASNAGNVVAFHPPITLKPVLSGDTFLIDVGTQGLDATLESSTDLTAGWSPFPSGAFSSGFQMPFESTTPVRFFRARFLSAF